MRLEDSVQPFPALGIDRPNRLTQRQSVNVPWVKSTIRTLFSKTGEADPHAGSDPPNHPEVGDGDAEEHPEPALAGPGIIAP